MDKELVRTIVVGMVTSIASYYLIKALDKRNVLPKAEQNSNK